MGAAPGPSRGLSVCLGTSEPRQLSAAAQLASALRTRGGGVAFDVGAHAGLYSLLFARHGLRVFAFEPLPRNLAWLHRTLEANEAKGVTVVPFALTGVTRLGRLVEGPHSSMGRLDASGDQPTLALSLGDFIAEYGGAPDILKIDIEGGEGELLRGGATYLGECKPSLLLSVHSEDLRSECLGLLASVGYTQVAPLDDDDATQAREFVIEA